MDPLATAAEIAALLQVAEAVPTLQQQRTSRKERLAAYLEYQRQAYKLMAGINHLSVLAQVKATSWQTTAVAVIPMISPFAETVLPDKLSDKRFIRTLQEMLRQVAEYARATSPVAPPIIATVHEGGNQLRDQVIVNVGRINDSMAEYLTALAVLRLVGRPGPVRASGVVNELLGKLSGNISVRDNRPWVERLVSKRKRDISKDSLDFGDYLDALWQANNQFMSEVRADRKERANVWEVWRKAPGQITSAKELLERNASDSDD